MTNGQDAPSDAGPLRVALLLNSPGKRFAVYEEIWEAVADSLRRAGAVVRMAEDVRDVSPDRDDLLLIVGTPNYVLGLPRGLADLRARFGRAILVFLWHTEFLPGPETSEQMLWLKTAKVRLDAWRAGPAFEYGNSRSENYVAIRQGVRRRLFDHVFVFTLQKARFLQRHGVPAEYLPVGHHPVWGPAGPETPALDAGARDIDVLYVGGRGRGRREDIVQALGAELEREGVAINTVYDFDPAGVWGEARNALLRRTKVYLCVYQHPLDFSGTRFCLGMSNGALVISEPVAEPFPFVPGRHFIEAQIADLSRAILTHLRDDAARERVSRQAREFLIREYTMAASAEHIIERAAGRAGLRGSAEQKSNQTSE